MSLSKAAAQLCEQTRSKPIAQLKASLTDQEVLAGYALILLDSDEIPVFGRKPRSKVLEEIPRIELEELALGDGATTLRAASGEGAALFTDLVIDRKHLRSFLSRIAPIPEE
jgi:hypothetical protein